MGCALPVVAAEAALLFAEVAFRARGKRGLVGRGFNPDRKAGKTSVGFSP